MPLDARIRRAIRLGMDVLATTAALVGCAIVVWTNWSTIFPPEPRVPTTTLSLEGATLRGSGAAPVVLIEYSDYLCPYCAKADAEILPRIVEQYIDSGRVQLAFRHHPLEKLHPGATKAAEAALCAGRAGAFWPMHTSLFADPKGVDEASLVARAHALGLDVERFSRCLAGETADQVRRDISEADTLELPGTPAFLVGRRQPDGRVKIDTVLRGARPLSDFQTAIDRALAGPHTGQASAVALVASGAGALAVAVWIRGRRKARTCEHVTEGGDA